jgi:membrane-associated protease RseP (regulator of RpoE activity)
VSSLIGDAGAVVFFILILVSVSLHEIGHFVPAKIFKIRVLQYFVGFGKTLWSVTKGGTQYGVKLIPLGGYVRLLGMYPPPHPGRDTWLKRLADDARDAEWDSITPDDVGQRVLFYQHPVWQRIIVMVSGVAMNTLIAYGLFLGVNLAHGQEVRGDPIVGRVIACVDETAQVCQPTPAARAGLEADDWIVAVNGVETATWSEMTAAVRDNGSGRLTLTIERDGTRIDLPAVDGAVATVADPADPGSTIEAGFLGVTEGHVLLHPGPIATARQMGTMVIDAAEALIRLPVSAVTMIVDVIRGEERDPSGPISVIGASMIAGEVAEADVDLGDKIALYATLLASLNLFVAVMNLLPFPPFDGGHIVAALWEKIRQGIARARGRVDHRPVDPAYLLPVAYIVWGVIALLGAIIIVADIVSPVSLF